MNDEQTNTIKKEFVNIYGNKSYVLISGLDEDEWVWGILKIDEDSVKMVERHSWKESLENPSLFSETLKKYNL